MTTTNEPKTHMLIILDKSGSMGDTDAIKEAAVSGFNELVEQAQEDATTQDILCYLITFNGEVFENLWGVTPDKLAKAKNEEFVPCGATAMRDAMGYGITKLLSTTDPNGEAAYLVYVISDGQTNSDKHYNVEAWKELVNSCEASKKWTITYMGCSKEYLMQIAEQTGTSVGNMAAWSNKSAGAAAAGFSNQKARQKRYFAARAAGHWASDNYANDSLEVADYTKEPVGLAEEAPIAPPAPAAAPVAMDVNVVLCKQPRYVAQANVQFAMGDSPFSNSQQVQWEADSSRQPGAHRVWQGNVCNAAFMNNKRC